MAIESSTSPSSRGRAESTRLKPGSTPSETSSSRSKEESAGSESRTRSAVLEHEDSVSLSGRDDDDFDPNAMRDAARSLRASRSSERESLLDGHTDEPMETPAERHDFTTSEEQSARIKEAGRLLDEHGSGALHEAAELMTYSSAGEVAEASEKLGLEVQQQVAERLITGAELNQIERTPEERLSGVTVVEQAKEEGGVNRLLAVSNPLDENDRPTGAIARNDAESGVGTAGDDTIRLVRAFDPSNPGAAEHANRVIEGESVSYEGTPEAYALNQMWSSADDPSMQDPQLSALPTGTTQPLGSEIDLDLVGGNNRITIDQPINTSGHYAQHQTYVQGSPNGLDTYDFDETVHAQTLPVSVTYNGEPLFSLPGSGGLGVDEIDIEQAAGGSSRFRIPYTRYQQLAKENPALADGRMFYRDGYLHISP